MLVLWIPPHSWEYLSLDPLTLNGIIYEVLLYQINIPFLTKGSIYSTFLKCYVDIKCVTKDEKLGLLNFTHLKAY